MSTQDDKFAKLSRKASGSMMPPDTSGIVVCPDGTGDFRSLEEALLRTPPGAKLRLKSGVHSLTAPVTLRQPVRLIGEGAETTKIIGSGIGFVIRVEGDGSFEVCGVTFCREGSNVGDVVQLLKGEVALRSCRFTGGRNLSKDDEDGNGLVIKGNVRAELEECEASDNAHTGFAIIGNATASIAHSYARKNSFGIGIGEDARATIRNCDASDNGFAGIAFADRAVGAAEHCSCLRNPQYGIVAAGTAAPTLTLNTCSHNQSGIGVIENAAATITRNTCTYSTASGIDIHDQAHPNVYENVCEHNTLCGIHFAHNTFGTARGNKCNSNKVAGIAVLHEAHPNLEDNTCESNEGGGIEFQDRTRGIARHNRCRSNAYGIIVVDTASPVVEENEGDVAGPTAGASSSSNSASSSDCFIATATFGSPHAKEVLVYRAFRDDVLRKCCAGRAFIRLYYWVGPLAASYVKPRRRLRTILGVILGRGAQLVRLVR